MTVRFAHITYERQIHVWRLRFPEASGSSDKIGDLIGFGGDARRPREELKVTMHLAGWGSVRSQAAGDLRTGYEWYRRFRSDRQTCD